MLPWLSCLALGKCWVDWEAQKTARRRGPSRHFQTKNLTTTGQQPPSETRNVLVNVVQLR